MIVKILSANPRSTVGIGIITPSTNARVLEYSTGGDHGASLHRFPSKWLRGVHSVHEWPQYYN